VVELLSDDASGSWHTVATGIGDLLSIRGAPRSYWRRGWADDVLQLPVVVAKNRTLLLEVIGKALPARALRSSVRWNVRHWLGPKTTNANDGTQREEGEPGQHHDDKDRNGRR